MGALRRHRQWAILISVAVCLLIAAGAISLTVVQNVSKGPAFESAAQFVRTDRVARQQLGVVLGFGIAVNGSVVEPGDGDGHANISFDVHGSWRDGHARISAVKQSGVWIVERGVLSVDGKQFRLRCDPTSSITRCLLS
jgi:cytochrome oxidase complex assembly protein 1